MIFEDHLSTSKAGFSIIEVMLSLLIMSMISIGMVSMISNQSREVQALTQKMTTLNVENLLRQSISSTNCVCLFNNGNLTASGSTGTWTWSTPQPTFYTSYNPSSSCAPVGPAFLKTGTSFGSGGAAVTIQNIMLDQIQSASATPSNAYWAALEVQYANTVRPMQNTSVRMYFEYDTTSHKITSCSASGGMGPWQSLTNQSGVVQQASSDGTLLASSSFNKGVVIYTSTNQSVLTQSIGMQLVLTDPSLRSVMSARDTYGSGYVTTQLPIRQGEWFVVFSMDKSHNLANTNLNFVEFRSYQ